MTDSPLLFRHLACLLLASATSRCHFDIRGYSAPNSLFPDLAGKTLP